VSAVRTAILSIHSHGDRSFLDDADLARLSGDLRQLGLASDLVLVVLAEGLADPSFAPLVQALAEYRVIVFERVWSAELVGALRRALPASLFVQLRGEHELQQVEADWVLTSEPRQSLPALVEFLSGTRPRPPAGCRERVGEGVRVHEGPSLERPRRLAERPNLHPRVIRPEAFSGARSFAIRGNGGCPYQADARDNPVYAGVHLPEGLGRGCAFCTTGNHYEGRPPAVVAAFVLDQLRWLRAEAPALERVVLKDQNPFAYLTEVVESSVAEGLGPFTLMLETRADWMLRSRARFERALEAARQGGLRLVPFLVGIENFSQPELDRYNKGIRAETNVAFLEWLWELRARFGETLAIDEASFGFVLFSPWTTLDDLETNHRAIVRTGFDRLRGRLLHARARLYPDTALYYLAERDGLFADAFAPGHDNAQRYGYFPARPWRHADPRVEHFARLATALIDETGGRDEVRTFGLLLDAFRARDPSTITLASLRDELALPPRDPALWERFARLVHPLTVDAELPGGFRVVGLVPREGGLRVELRHASEAAFAMSVLLRRAAHAPRAPLARSRHYDVAAPEGLTASQQASARAISDAIARGDP
jgi:hypothetical protein